jgi:hypothetical protein
MCWYVSSYVQPFKKNMYVDHCSNVIIIISLFHCDSFPIGTKSELLCSFFPTDNIDSLAPAGLNKFGTYPSPMFTHCGMFEKECFQ